MSLNLTLGQTLTVTPSLIGMMQIMQMNSLELTAYLQELSLENPLVEVQEPTEARASAQQRRWLESLDAQNRAFEQSDRQSQGIPDPNPETLEAYLLRQVAALNLSARIGKTVEYLIALLDENGWLEEDVPELCRLTGQPQAVVDAALAQLQSMEPAGVGAANLEDCLLLQLDQEENTSPLARAIVKNHLEDVAAGRYEKIAKALQASVAEVRAACNRIRSLDPRPGQGYAARNQPEYVVPDVTVEVDENGLSIQAVDGSFPALEINQTYLELLKTTQDPEVQAYLKEKLAQVDQLQMNIETRKQNTLRCAQAIVARQEAFFLRGGALAPMTLADLADELGLHTSTVSRAARGKYLLCAQGVYPLSYFFSRSLGGQYSAHSARQALADLVASEDSSRPWSDQQLTDQLVEQGFTISRRTVAKYRQQMGLGTQAQRRRDEEAEE